MGLSIGSLPTRWVCWRRRTMRRQVLKPFVFGSWSLTSRNMGPDLRRTSHVLWFIIALPAMSVGIAWISFHMLGLVTWKYSFLIAWLGVLGAYSLLYQLFDHFVWRWSIFRWLRIVSQPSMGGRWKGELKTSREDTRPLPAIVEVRQTFGHTTVNMYFAQSRSFSLMTQFVNDGNGFISLHYEYQNVPGADAEPTMYTHFGTARLECI